MKSNILYRNYLKQSYRDLFVQSVSALTLYCPMS